MNKVTWKEYIDLFESLGEIKECVTLSEPDMPIKGLTYDSKMVEEGTLFVCKGANFKKQYLFDAINQGATCYVSQIDYAKDEDDPEMAKKLKEMPHVIVNDIRRCMPDMARLFYDYAENKIEKVGVTGTTGKTTTSYCIKAIYDVYLSSLGKEPMGIFSSAELHDGKTVELAPNQTTPEAFELHRRFYNLCESNRDHLVMEVSSQAIKYGRTTGIKFEGAIFTNISNDHVSDKEHPSYEDYLETKINIFKQAKIAVVNLACDDVDKVLEGAKCCEKIVTFAATRQIQDELIAKPTNTINKNNEDLSKADYRLVAVDETVDNLIFTIEGPGFTEDFEMPMHGIFNAFNALAAIAYCHTKGISIEQIKEGISKAVTPGHMVMVKSPDERIISFIDYAHNGISYETLFKSAKRLYPDRRLVCVFGSTGGKAINRRFDIGRAVGKYCDMAYITMDCPYNEPVSKIAADIAEGVKSANGKWVIIEDRAQAIRQAAFDAVEPTVICMTGRGVEDCQNIGNDLVPYITDGEIIQAAYDEIYKVEK